MRTTPQILLIAAVAAVVVVAAGCQTKPVGSKQARLYAAENIELREQVAILQAEIETLKQGHAEQIEWWQAQLAESTARNETLQNDIRRGVAERVDEVMAAVVDENTRLRKEVEQLRTRVEAMVGDPVGTP